MNSLPKVLNDILEKRYVLKQNFIIEQSSEDEEEVFDERQLVDIGSTIASFVPGVGDLISLYDFVDSVVEGEYGEATLALASALPIVGAPADVVRAARKVKRTIERLPNLKKVNKQIKIAKEIKVPSKQSPDYPRQMFKSEKDVSGVEVKPSTPKPDYTPWPAPKPEPTPKPPSKLPEPEPISVPKVKPFKWGRELFPEAQPYTPPEFPTPEAETTSETQAELDPLAQRIAVMAAPSVLSTPTPLPQPQPKPEKLEKDISTQTKEEEEEERRRRFPSLQAQDRKPRSLQSLMGTGVPADTGLQKKLFLGQFGGTYQIQ